MNNNMSDKQKEQLAQKMFDKIKNNIGKTVTVKFYSYGGLTIETGELKNIIPYNRVETIGCSIPFVGYGVAITSIVLTETKEELYSNPHIELYYDRRDKKSIEDSRRKIFGNSIVDNEKNERLQNEKKQKENDEKTITDAQLIKYKMIKEGFRLVRPETKEQWANYVINHSNDVFSIAVLKAVVLMLNSIEKGISFKDAEEQIYNKGFGLEYNMAKSVEQAVIYFSPKGEEYEQHCVNKTF